MHSTVLFCVGLILLGSISFNECHIISDADSDEVFLARVAPSSPIPSDDLKTDFLIDRP